MAKPDFNRYDYIECWLPTQKDAFIKRGYRILEKDDISLLQVDRPHVTYFNCKGKIEKKGLYDVLYNPDKGYDQKSKRCDRQSESKAKKTLYEEERNRLIPVRVNSGYGKKNTDLEGTPLSSYHRYNKCKEFKCRNNINMKPDEGLLVKNDTPV